MGPHWFRSIVYDCSVGFFDGSSGFYRAPFLSAPFLGEMQGRTSEKCYNIPSGKS